MASVPEESRSAAERQKMRLDLELNPAEDSTQSATVIVGLVNGKATLEDVA